MQCTRDFVLHTQQQRTRCVYNCTHTVHRLSRLMCQNMEVMNRSTSVQLACNFPFMWIQFTVQASRLLYDASAEVRVVFDYIACKYTVLYSRVYSVHPFPFSISRSVGQEDVQYSGCIQIKGILPGSSPIYIYKCIYSYIRGAEYILYFIMPYYYSTEVGFSVTASMYSHVARCMK